MLHKILTDKGILRKPSGLSAQVLEKFEIITFLLDFSNSI